MAKKKSLQKVTDIEKLKTVKDIKAFVKNNPERANEVIGKLKKLLDTSYSEKLGLEDEIVDLISKCCSLTGNETKDKYIRNVTYETNHRLITSFIHNHILEYRGFPTFPHIAENTGLSRQTIYKHLKSGLQNEYNSMVRGKFEYMTSNALEKLYLIGIEDNNATALKHFIELSGAVTKKPTTNNYIQINNLKISKDEFNQLPTETILEIETLISKSITSK